MENAKRAEMKIRGIIFDLDGVLIDSERLHFKTWQIIFGKRGERIYWKDFVSQIGRTALATARHFCQIKKIECPLNELVEQRVELYQKLMTKDVAFPGAVGLVKLLARKYPQKIALATSEWKEIARTILRRLGIEKQFSVIVGKEDVKQRKPHPETYIKSAKKLGLKPGQCVVFEDSIVGVQAAKRAGCKCIAVTNSFPRSVLEKARADLIVDSLMEKKNILYFLATQTL